MKKISSYSLAFLFVAIGCGIVYYNTYFLFTYERVKGVVVDMKISRGSEGETMYAPVVGYRGVDGEEQRMTPHSSTSWRPKIGSEKFVYIREGAEPRLFGVLFPVIGVFFAGVGLIFLPFWTRVFDARRRRKMQQLRRSGDILDTDFVSVEKQIHSKNNTTLGFIVHTQYHDVSSGLMRTFASHRLQYDPTDLIAQDKIKVYTKRGDRTDYVMDLTFLPKHSNRK